MKSSDFIFNYFHFLYYKCHKINFENSRSYIDSSEWIKKVKLNPMKKKIINVFNTLNNCVRS